MVVHRPRAFFRRFGAAGLIGFGESYMAGDWDCADLTGLLTVFAAHVADLIPPWLQRLRALAGTRPPAGDEQTRDGARHNIRRHYDLSNELFALFLDETMTYSSALFPAEPTAPRWPPAIRWPGRSAARSTPCSTGPGSGPGPGCWRSAPAGVSWPSGPPPGAPA